MRHRHQGQLHCAVRLPRVVCITCHAGILFRIEEGPPGRGVSPECAVLRPQPRRSGQPGSRHAHPVDEKSDASRLRRNGGPVATQDGLGSCCGRCRRVPHGETSVDGPRHKLGAPTQLAGCVVGGTRQHRCGVIAAVCDRCQQCGSQVPPGCRIPRPLCVPGRRDHLRQRRSVTWRPEAAVWAAGVLEQGVADIDRPASRPRVARHRGRRLAGSNTSFIGCQHVGQRLGGVCAEAGVEEHGCFPVGSQPLAASRHVTRDQAQQQRPAWRDVARPMLVQLLRQQLPERPSAACLCNQRRMARVAGRDAGSHRVCGAPCSQRVERGAAWRMGRLELRRVWPRGASHVRLRQPGEHARPAGHSLQPALLLGSTAPRILSVTHRHQLQRLRVSSHLSSAHAGASRAGSHRRRHRGIQGAQVGGAQRAQRVCTACQAPQRHRSSIGPWD